MTQRTSTIVLAGAAFLMLTSICGLAAEYTHIWIDQEGGVNRSDTPGTQEQPFKSITYALTRAEYLERPDPWWVHVGPGVYDANSVKPQNEQEAFPIQLRHEMIFEGIDPCSCILDGRHETATDHALLFGETATLQIRGLTLQNMYHAWGNGGAIELVNCAGQVQNCVFHNNSASYGGGFYLSPPVGPPSAFNIVSCKFTANAGNGAGFCVEGTLTGDIVDCAFVANSGSLRGGGFKVSDMHCNIERCRFSNNSASVGAGFSVDGTFNGDIIRCSFSENSARGFGGGFRAQELNGDVVDCTFTDNAGSDRGGGFLVDYLAGTAKGGTFARNSAKRGGGLYLTYSPDANISGCNFVDNVGTRGGSAVYCDFYSIRRIANCRFSGHEGTAITLHGQGQIGVDPVVRIHDCLFVAPDSLGNADGWVVNTCQKIIFSNNTIVGRGLDTSAWDRALYIMACYFGQPPNNSQVFNNVVVGTKEAIHVGELDDIPIAHNCFYDVEQIVGQGETYLGNDLWWIESKLGNFRNNVYRDPGFVAGDLTYHIGADSPCIDSGDPNYVPDANETDLDGKPRLAGPAVDKGAYEYTAGCLGESHEDYLEWISLGRPACWCYPRQCHGDADGLKEGDDKGGYYYVGAADLNTLMAAWQVKEPPMGPGIARVENGICADFAHDLAGNEKTGFYRVGPSDLNILIQTWLVREPPHGPSIEPNCLE